uniref:Uncharacterized protein n=1 Tax=Glossina austeni TaxID=7395 RepID=A0A1A9UR22_GLOAU
MKRSCLNNKISNQTAKREPNSFSYKYHEPPSRRDGVKNALGPSQKISDQVAKRKPNSFSYKYLKPPSRRDGVKKLGPSLLGLMKREKRIDHNARHGVVVGARQTLGTLETRDRQPFLAAGRNQLQCDYLSYVWLLLIAYTCEDFHIRASTSKRYES